MIFKKVLKYLLLDKAINSFFDSLQRNIVINEINNNDIKVGDYFSKILATNVNDHIFIYTGCTIMIADKIWTSFTYKNVYSKTSGMRVGSEFSTNWHTKYLEFYK